MTETTNHVAIALFANVGATKAAGDGESVGAGIHAFLKATKRRAAAATAGHSSHHLATLMLLNGACAVVYAAWWMRIKAGTKAADHCSVLATVGRGSRMTIRVRPTANATDSGTYQETVIGRMTLSAT